MNRKEHAIFECENLFCLLSIWKTFIQITGKYGTSPDLLGLIILSVIGMKICHQLC